MIDKRFYKSVVVFAGYLVALLPLYFAVGLANLHFGWRISYQTACSILLVIAITVAGNIYAGKHK